MWASIFFAKYLGVSCDQAVAKRKYHFIPYYLMASRLGVIKLALNVWLRYVLTAVITSHISCILVYDNILAFSRRKRDFKVG